ncbi:MAG: TonB-dependent receptor [Flavipsychrobacter sp.]
MQYLYKHSLLTFGLFSCLGTAFAQSADTAKYHSLEAVEVQAVRASSNDPFAKTEIGKKEIEKQNLGQDLPMLLQFTPSAVTTSDAGAGVGYTGLRIRGTDATRINVTLNGMPVNDPEEQAVYFVDLPDLASSTNSIQIQRGVGTSTNGAGAFGATVSISNIQQMDSAGVVLSSSAGSFSTFKNTLVAGTGMLKGGWQFDVRLSKISSLGYIQHSASDLKSLQFTAGWKASEKTWLHFMVMTGVEKTQQAWDGVPEDSVKPSILHPNVNTSRRYNELGWRPDGSYYSNQTDNYQQDYYQLFADHKFSPFLTGHVGLFLTRGRGYYQEYQPGQILSANYGLPTIGKQDSTDLIRQLWLDNYYYGGVFSLMYQKNKTKLTLGGAATQFENQHYGIIKWTQNGGVPDDYKWYNHDAQKNDFNVYLKWEQDLTKDLIFFADAQFRNTAFFINGFQDRPDQHPTANYDFFNPKIGLTYFLKNTAAEVQKLYASMAVGNREPNSADFDVDLIYQPKPETLYDEELGYEINKRKWSAGANLYYMRYHNQLVLTGQLDSVGNYIQTNVPNSYRMGIELQGAAKPLSWLTINGNATFSQNKIKNFTEYIYNYDDGSQDPIHHTNTDISFSPSVIGALNVTFVPFRLPENQNFEIGITGKYVSRQYLDNTSNKSRSIDPYNFFNLLMKYSIKVRPFKEIDATMMVNNIFSNYYNTNGSTYESISNGSLSTVNYYFPQALINVLGGVTLQF